MPSRKSRLSGGAEPVPTAVDSAGGGLLLVTPVPTAVGSVGGGLFVVAPDLRGGGISGLFRAAAGSESPVPRVGVAAEFGCCSSARRGGGTCCRGDCSPRPSSVTGGCDLRRRGGGRLPEMGGSVSPASGMQAVARGRGRRRTQISSEHAPAMGAWAPPRDRAARTHGRLGARASSPSLSGRDTARCGGGGGGRRGRAREVKGQPKGLAFTSHPAVYLRFVVQQQGRRPC